MIKDDFQWVLRGDLIPKYNLEDWYEESPEWELMRSLIWHYGNAL